MKNFAFFTLLLFVSFAIFSCKSKSHSQKDKMKKREMEMRIEIEKEKAKRESERKEKSIKKFELPDDFEATDSAAVNPSLGGFVSPTFVRKVDKEAEYIYGLDTLIIYVTENFKVSDFDKQNNQTYNFNIQFTVDVNGKCANFIDLSENSNTNQEPFNELVRIFRSLKWNPAKLNGMDVNSYKKLEFKIVTKSF